VVLDEPMDPGLQGQPLQASLKLTIWQAKQIERVQFGLRPATRAATDVGSGDIYGKRRSFVSDPGMSLPIAFRSAIRSGRWRGSRTNAKKRRSCESPFTQVMEKCRRQESNLRTRFRKPLLFH
jgi:hypothetical protein